MSAPVEDLAVTQDAIIKALEKECVFLGVICVF